MLYHNPQHYLQVVIHWKGMADWQLLAIVSDLGNSAQPEIVVVATSVPQTNWSIGWPSSTNILQTKASRLNPVSLPVRVLNA